MRKYVADLNGNILINEAKHRGFKFKIICQEPSIFSIKKGRKEEFFLTNRPARGTMLSTVACKSKRAAKVLMQKAGIKTPRGGCAPTGNWPAVSKLAQSLKFPLVAKPNSRSCGRDVYVGLRSAKELRRVVNKMKDNYGRILLEKKARGGDIRIYAVAGKIIAAVERRAPAVTGDGKSNICQLISRYNRQNEDHPLFVAVMANDVVKDYLRQQKLTLASMPAKNRRIQLKGSVNIHGGGQAIDVTAKIHPGYKEIVRRAYKALFEPLLLGLDIMTPDFAKNPKNAGYSIIEANSCPDIDFHHFPHVGKSRNVAGAILDYIF